MAAREDLAGEKVVARYLDGRLVKGYTHDFRVSRRDFHLFSSRDASAEPVRVLLDDLKAVFCVRDFVGNRHYTERKRFEGQAGAGRRVELTFVDGEVLVGTIGRYSPAERGFFLFPADRRCNNLKVFALSAAVRRLRPLTGDPPAAGPSTSEPSGVKLPVPQRVLSWLSRPRLAANRTSSPRHPPAGAAPGSRQALAGQAGREDGRLVRLLVNDELLTETQAQQVLAEHRATHDAIPLLVVRLGLIGEEVLLDFLSRRFRLPVMELSHLEIPEETAGLLRREIVQKYSIFPVRKVDRTLTLALSDPTLDLAVDDVRFATGLQVIPVLASAGAIREAIDRHYATGPPAAREHDQLGTQPEAVACRHEELRAEYERLRREHEETTRALEELRLAYRVVQEKEKESSRALQELRERCEAFLRDRERAAEQLEVVLRHTKA